MRLADNNLSLLPSSPALAMDPYKIKDSCSDKSLAFETLVKIMLI